MPWKVASAMSQREEFVALAHSEGVNMSELCLRSGISRKTGYKWLSRYLKAGEQSLDDLPKRPHHSPNRTGAEMEQLVVDLRREHPTKGGHVLARMLKDRGHNSVPTKSTITAILRRHRLIEPADSLKHKAYRRFEHQRPNDLWQMDFIPVGSCGRCHPLTVLDDHSRFSLGVRACADEKTQTVHDHLTSIFRRYGMPGYWWTMASPSGSDFYHPFSLRTGSQGGPLLQARARGLKTGSREGPVPLPERMERLLQPPAFWTSASRYNHDPPSTIPMTRYAPSISTAEYPSWGTPLGQKQAGRAEAHGQRWHMEGLVQPIATIDLSR